MKRDFEKIREMLLSLETSEDGIKINGDEKIDSVAKTLSQAGFVAVYLPKDRVCDLTWKGQDFVEIVRDETRWQAIKDYIKQENLPLVMDNIVSVSKEKFVLKKNNDSEPDTEEVKSKIIKSATKIFSEKHYANTKMLDIANDAGVSRGPLYYYYKTKADLFKAVIRDYAEQLFKMNFAIAEGKELSLELIRQLIDTNINRLFEFNEANLMSDLFHYEEFKEEAQLMRSHTEGIYNILLKCAEYLSETTGAQAHFSPREIAGMAMTCYYGIRGLVTTEYYSTPIYHMTKDEINEIINKVIKFIFTVYLGVGKRD